MARKDSVSLCFIPKDLHIFRSVPCRFSVEHTLQKALRFGSLRLSSLRKLSSPGEKKRRQKAGCHKPGEGAGKWPKLKLAEAGSWKLEDV